MGIYHSYMSSNIHC